MTTKNCLKKKKALEPKRIVTGISKSDRGVIEKRNSDGMIKQQELVLGR